MTIRDVLLNSQYSGPMELALRDLAVSMLAFFEHMVAQPGVMDLPVPESIRYATERAVKQMARVSEERRTGRFSMTSLAQGGLPVSSWAYEPSTHYVRSLDAEGYRNDLILSGYTDD